MALGAVVAAAAVSCAKEEVVENATPDTTPSAKQYYSYSFDVAEQETRAVLEYEGVFWEENDAVGMYLAGAHTEANIDIETSPKTIFLNSTSPVPSGSTAYAYYPFDERNTSAGSTIVGIPHEQVGGAVSAMPMVGIPFTVSSGDTNGEVYFLNLGAIIDFKVYSATHSDETVQYIILQDDNGTVSGDAVLDLSAIDPDDESTLALESWGTNHYSYVTVRREASVASDKDGAASVYMVVAPGAYASGKIIIGTDKATYTFNYSNRPLSRNELKHYNMNLDSANCTREATKSLPYSETFESNSVDFTTDGVTIESTSTAVWQYNDANHVMKASAYNNKAAHAATSWLMSPWIDLTDVASASVSFDHSHRYEDSPSSRLTLWVLTDEAGAEWQQLTISTYAGGSDLASYVSSGDILLDEFVGHNLKIGFKYVSTSNSSQCATWQIKNFMVEEIEPTPVYSLYSGDLTEGDYVLYYDGKALKNEVSSSKFAYTTVTPSGSDITDPDASIVWHIAPSSTSGYWTIYNAEVKKYVCGSQSNTNVSLADDANSDAALWSVTETYDFRCKSNEGQGTVRYLRYYSSNDVFGNYASNNGGALSLYKLGYSSSGSGSGSGSGGSGSGGDETPVSGLQYLGCIEVPALALVDEEACTASGTETFGDTKWYAYNTTTSTRRVATHTYEYNSKQYRNYTVMVDQDKRCPLWGAYPMHKGAYPSNKLGRAGSFKDSHSYDPAFARGWQSSGSTSDYNGGAGYARGHLCASADRQAVEEANEQTFYYTNQAPQIQNSFNSGVWSALEGDVQSNAPSAAGDTLYVVSGVLFETNNTGSSNDGGTVGRPSHFYKLLMRCTYSGGTITAAQGIAFLYTNEAHSGVKYYNASFVTSIDAIETRAGFDFFANVPTSVQNAAEANTSHSWFTGVN